MKYIHYSLSFASSFFSCWLIAFNPTIAQIIPDSTLPNNSITIPDANNIRIEGGTTSGSNLFHSFQEFSLPTGSEAFFNNAVDIQNIFSRVTGSNISNIDGLIRANGVANLFLINPNGIIFGQNAQLNIGGSFISSTANSIKFRDGIEFNATNPNSASLLTISVPIGLQFEAKNGSIVNQSRVTAPVILPTLPIPLPFDNKVGLAVAPGQTLALIGGDIQLNGGNLTASTGQIFLGSVASPGLVSFTPTPFGLTLNYDNITKFGNIEISNGSIINASGIGGGKVDIRGGNVTLSGARIYGLTLGNIDGRAIDINAQNLRLEGGSQLSTLALGVGKGGDINIGITDAVEISGLGIEGYLRFYSQYLTSVILSPFDPQIVLLTSTVGSGAAGNINIDTGRLLLSNGVVGGTATLGAGNGGNLTIRANTIEMIGSAINSGTIRESVGQGGSIAIDAVQLIMRDGSYLLSLSNTDGSSGNITIKTSESVELSGGIPGSTTQTIISTTTSNGNGKAGDITIDTKRLTVSDGAGIALTTGANIGQLVRSTSGGPGGNLTVRASESIEVSGVSGVLGDAGYAPSGFSTQTFSFGQGGNINLWTPLLSVRGGGIITAGSLGAADAGDITINASRIVVEGIGNGGLRSGIEASSGTTSIFVNPNATGNAGSLNVNARELAVKDGAIVTVRALGTGRAGNMNLVADTLSVDRQGSIDGRTASGTGANLNLTSQNIQLRGNSRIGTDAGNSTGGNINIDTNTLVALENSDITANAIQGSGGRVSITTQGIFGTQFRDELTPQSDITASSDLGAQFSGTVEINTPDVDPSSGLVELSANYVDVSNTIATGCRTTRDNSFTVTGRGILAINSTELLSGQMFWHDWRLPSQSSRRGGGGRRRFKQFPITNSQLPIIEVTGWQINSKGEVELVANASGMIVNNPWTTRNFCSV